MTLKDVTVEELAARINRDVRTISRLRNDIEYNSKAETVIAVCIALHLQPLQSLYLLGLAGFNLTMNQSKTKQFYMILVMNFYECSVAECNEILKQNHITPLL